MNSISATRDSSEIFVFDRYKSAECEFLRRAVSAAIYAETHDTIDALMPTSKVLSEDFAVRHGLMLAVDKCIVSFMRQSKMLEEARSR